MHDGPEAGRNGTAAGGLTLDVFYVLIPVCKCRSRKDTGRGKGREYVAKAGDAPQAPAGIRRAGQGALMKNAVRRKEKGIVYISGLAAMFFCAGFTSPLYPYYIGTDTSIFLIMAKGIVNGKVPYLNLYDHKGPIFFWMEALGYLFGGRTGVFLFQCLLFLADLYLLEKISFLFHASFPAVSAVFASAFFYLFSHGNLTEEFSMPLVLAALYLQLRFLLSGEKKHSPAAGFFYGIILGLLSFIRLNNAVIPCCMIFCIAILLIQEREWVNLSGNLALGLLGVSAVAFPVCLYFYRHGTLSDMLYATFLHNMLYARSAAHYPVFSSAFLRFFFLFLPGAASFFIFLEKWRTEKKRVWLSLGFTVIMTYGMLAYTNKYIHYFLLGVPLFAVAAVAADREESVFQVWKDAAALLLRRKGGERISFRPGAALIAAVTALYLMASMISACAPVYKTYLTEASYNLYAEVQSGLDLIPEEERDSVIVYNVMTKFYFYADILPCFKYFALQNWMTTDVVNVNQEFMEFLKEDHPLWVVAYVGEQDETFREILDSDYYLIGTDSFLNYYRYAGKEEQ